jgi:hypothetical protein
MMARTLTGPGRPAALPEGSYTAPAPVREGWRGREVLFEGEDGRSRAFCLDELALPGWREAVAATFVARTGATGGLRTLASAHGQWQTAQRFLRFLSGMDPVPAEPGLLTVAHLDGFHVDRAASLTRRGALAELRRVISLLDHQPLRGMLSAEVIDYLGRRWHDPRSGGRPGYSDGELARILSAARSDVVAICNRFEATEQLVTRYRADPGGLTAAEHLRASQLAEIAATGVVPWPDGVLTEVLHWRAELAQRLFLNARDLVPLLVLAVGLTGRNVETVKELPARYRLMDEVAVEVTTVKRRRGAGHWYEQATWEIGVPSRRLHTAGGFYLLLHRLTTSSRAFSGSKSIWSIWRNGNRAEVTGAAEHHGPFAAKLNPPLRLCDWAARHDLRDDSDRRLKLELNRLRTSVEVRRTKQLGGHLPSAVRTNTMQTMWGSYLRGDPTVIAWADDVLDEAFVDAEQAALEAHQRALARHSGALRIVPGAVTAGELANRASVDAVTAAKATAGELDTAWSACTDPEDNPWNGGRCAMSFLDCFHCGNCLITADHLPRLLALLDALEQRRQQMSLPAWWRRYGPAWAAIRRQVLPEFSPAEVAAAQAAKPGDALLDLVEGPRQET